jgi:hypothetical protein
MKGRMKAIHMKNNFYFQHDSNARNDEKILELRCEFGNEAYAIYFMLLESMSETSDGYLNREAIGGLSLGYNIAKDRLSAIIDKCIELNLFILEENLFTSKRMQEHLEFRQKLQNAGKKGAKARWSTRQKNSHPISPPNGEAYAKGKERKGNNIYTSNENLIFSYFENLEESNQKIIDIAKEFDIRPKDVIWCIRDMLSRSSDKNVEIKNVKSKLNIWINNAIRWHKVATLTSKEEEKKPKYKDIDEFYLKTEGVKLV